MRPVISIIQVVISILLIASILIQAKGTGLGSAWGGSGEFYQSKRGVEKIVFNATIVLVVLFFLISVVSLLAK